MQVEHTSEWVRASLLNFTKRTNFIKIKIKLTSSANDDSDC